MGIAKTLHNISISEWTLAKQSDVYLVLLLLLMVMMMPWWGGIKGCDFVDAGIFSTIVYIVLYDFIIIYSILFQLFHWQCEALLVLIAVWLICKTPSMQVYSHTKTRSTNEFLYI